MHEPTQVPELYSPREIAKLLKVPIGTIYYWVSRREVPFLKIGKHLRFNYLEVLRKFESSSVTCFGDAVHLGSHVRSLKTKDSDHAELRRKE
ncbi:MAG: helix-turn-helix domain-containing protein [Bacteriovoracia bacterium]